jgi:hypothetical protein
MKKAMKSGNVKSGLIAGLIGAITGTISAVLFHVFGNKDDDDVTFEVVEEIPESEIKKKK